MNGNKEEFVYGKLYWLNFLNEISEINALFICKSAL